MSLIAPLVDNWCFPPAYGHDPIHEKWVQLTLLLLVGNEGEMKSQVSDERWSWAAANRCAVHVVSVRLSSILDTPCTCMFDRVSCCCMLGNTGGTCCWDGWSQRELRVSAMAPGCPRSPGSVWVWVFGDFKGFYWYYLFMTRAIHTTYIL